MSCCCVKILNLCSKAGCDAEIDLGITATVQGFHKLEVNFLGAEYPILKTFTIGEAIKFPITVLNENQTFTAALYDPSGVKILITKDAIQYDCISFKTKLQYALN